MIRPASRADLPRLRQLLARANDAPYDLPRVAEEKCFGAGVTGAPAVRVHGDFEGVSVTCGGWLRILAVDRRRRGRGIGTALLREAEARGTFGIAAEAGNYFTPGVLEAQAPFFAGRGYHVTATTQNLETSALPDAVPEAVTRAGRDDRDRIRTFIERDFGAIWAFEAARAFENDPPTLFFFVAPGGDVAGFAAHDANNRGLGFFGPTGVTKALRGKGIGTQLLQACLADARRLGYGRVIIPWTDAVDFYTKACAARVAHRFLVMRRAG